MPQTTTFTFLCGTTITFFTGRPSRARMTLSSASAAASTSSLPASRAIVSSSLRLPSYLYRYGDEIVNEQGSSTAGQG